MRMNVFLIVLMIAAWMLMLLAFDLAPTASYLSITDTPSPTAGVNPTPMGSGPIMEDAQGCAYFPIAIR